MFKKKKKLQKVNKSQIQPEEKVVCLDCKPWSSPSRLLNFMSILPLLILSYVHDYMVTDHFTNHIEQLTPILFYLKKLRHACVNMVITVRSNRFLMSIYIRLFMNVFPRILSSPCLKMHIHRVLLSVRLQWVHFPSFILKQILLIW